MVAPLRARLAQAMAESLRHRGPDGYGLWAGPGAKLAIAHRRLAIQGLGEEGAQPMLDPTRRYVLCYNGELFGALGLRAELIHEGVVFRGMSDTEILLHALAHWGVPETLARIRGQFAFAWYDAVSQRLFLVRDRIGVRPLYYAASGRRLAVASEQKALLLLDWVDRSPRLEGMLRYLALSRTSDVPGETLLAGIKSLPAGHWAEWDGSALRVHRYFRAEAASTAATIDVVRGELERAVAEQLVGDVPIGAMVSGGLDSSSVVLLADRARAAAKVSAGIHLFAYHDNLAEKDERPYQRAVLSAFTSPHEVHWVSSSPSALSAEFERYVHHQEEPYGDVSSYAEYCVAAEAARHGVKVILSGLGGGEAFVGYGAYLGPLMLDLMAEGRLGAAVDLLTLSPSLGSIKPGQVAFAALYHALPSRLRNALSAARASRSVGLSPAHSLAATRDAYRAFHTHDGRARKNSARQGSLESWSVPRYLAHSDRMGLAFGVEGRVPLLDEGVLSAAWALPTAERLGKRGWKAPLRAAAAHVLPSLVRDRADKPGFYAPLRAYVTALDEQLAEGHRAALAALGAAPAWATLDFHARWLWGNLGAYLSWVARSPRETARDAASSAALMAIAGSVPGVNGVA